MTNFLCNLVLPGAAKSGTSSLHLALDRHPKVCMSTPKEPQFFSSERYHLGASAHNTFFTYSQGARWYGESSQWYAISDLALKRIKSELKRPKALIVLREPVERAISHYAYNLRLGYETRPCKEAMESAGRNTTYLRDSNGENYREVGGYIAHSAYSEWVPKWQQELGSENVLVICFEHLKKDPAVAFKNIWKFLGLEEIQIEALTKTNAGNTTYTRARPLYALAARRMLPKTFKSSRIYATVRNRLLERLTKNPASAELMQARAQLKAELAGDIEFYRSFSRSGI